jgi:hypothetical protein
MPRRRRASPELRAVQTNDLNDEQKAALFLGGVERMESLINRKDELVAQIRNQRKAMKADGFGREEVDYALWFRKHSEGEANEGLAMRIRIAEWLGKPLGFQATLDLAAQ